MNMLEELNLPSTEVLRGAFTTWLSDYEVGVTERWENLRPSEWDLLAEAQWVSFLEALTLHIQHETQIIEKKTGWGRSC